MKLINFLTLILLLSQLSFAQSTPDKLIDAMRKGDAEELSLFFHQNLEMTILEKVYMSSKTQATRIMEDFFRNNTPIDFTISFEGTKEKSRYAIGILKTKDNSFRVNLFFLIRDDEKLIYYLSIEKESEYELQS
ncbi:MAG: DUF4783 domain-containing protein [Bacteroidales bacterium]|nr:DUF4783 domain-containing protein [Bacteroidales bacterium]MBN2699140.1 DUF4783 domain-containing protein [Bacteroidales bacterium]